MQIEIIKAAVLLTDGCDKVSLSTKFPCPFVPEFLPSQPPLRLDFDTTKDTAVEYCRQYLGIEPEVKDVRTTSPKHFGKKEV